MKERKPYFKKSEINESLILTPKTPMKSHSTRHIKIKASPFSLTNTMQNKNINTPFSYCDNEDTENVNYCFRTFDSFGISFDGVLIFTKLENKYIYKNYDILAKVGHGDYSDVFLVGKRDDLMLIDHRSYISCGNDLLTEGDVPGFSDGDEPNTQSDKSDISRFSDKCDYKNKKETSDSDRTICFIQENATSSYNDDYFQGRSYSKEKLASIFCKRDTNLKCIKRNKRAFKGEKDRENKLREVLILYRLKGRSNVLQIEEAWEDDGTLLIETVYCSYGNLKEYIHQVYFTDQSMFSKQLIDKLIHEVSRGLAEIHSLGIIHADIKPANIYIRSKDMQMKCKYTCTCEFPEQIDKFEFVIGDFNISRFEGDEMEEDGDKKYMAPEVLNSNGTVKSDVYSLGLIYLELLTGIVLPKAGDVWLKLRKNKFDDLELTSMNKNTRSLLFKMIDMNHDNRISSEELKNVFQDRHI